MVNAISNGGPWILCSEIRICLASCIFRCLCFKISSHIFFGSWGELCACRQYLQKFRSRMTPKETELSVFPLLFFLISVLFLYSFNLCPCCLLLRVDSIMQRRHIWKCHSGCTLNRWCPFSVVQIESAQITLLYQWARTIITLKSSWKHDEVKARAWNLFHLIYLVTVVLYYGKNEDTLFLRSIFS